jgi:hypothetical protein
MPTERSREARVRRTAERRGITVRKVRRIDREALDYGTWVFDDPRRGVHESGLSLADVERRLFGASPDDA